MVIWKSKKLKVVAIAIGKAEFQGERDYMYFVVQKVLAKHSFPQEEICSIYDC